MPVIRAIVSISQEDNQVAFGTTDANGFFEKQLPLGSYSVSIKKLGFSPITELVSIQENEVLTFIDCTSSKQSTRNSLPFRDFLKHLKITRKSVSDIRDALGLGQSQFGLRLAGRQTHRLGFLHY